MPCQLNEGRSQSERFRDGRLIQSLVNILGGPKRGTPYFLKSQRKLVEDMCDKKQGMIGRVKVLHIPISRVDIYQ